MDSVQNLSNLRARSKDDSKNAGEHLLSYVQTNAQPTPSANKAKRMNEDAELFADGHLLNSKAETQLIPMTTHMEYVETVDSQIEQENMPEGQESDLKQIIKQYTSRNKIDYMDKEKQQLINSEKGPGRMARFSYVDTESQAHRDVEGSEMQELDVDIADNIQVGSPPSKNVTHALRT